MVKYLTSGHFAKSRPFLLRSGVEGNHTAANNKRSC